MAYDDPKFGKIFPTRTGGAVGQSIERKMLDGIGGSDSFRTVVRNFPDGSKTICRTNNGMPRFETTRANQGRDRTCVWSFCYHPLKIVNGAYVPDTMSFGEHVVPQMSIMSGSKIRRKGVSLTSNNGVVTNATVLCGASAYEGVDETTANRIHGSHYWYRGDQVVSWTKRTYIPVENPITGLPKWVPVGVVRYRTTEIEVFVIGGGEEEAIMTVLAACLVGSPDGTQYIRVAVARQQSTLVPLQSVDVKDYTLSGRFVSEKRIEEAAYFHNIVEGFSPAAWAPNGLSLIVGIPYDQELGANAIARIYNVTRPNGGIPTSSYSIFTTDVSCPTAQAHSTVTVVSDGVPEITQSGNLSNLAPGQFEVPFYQSSYNKYTKELTVYLDLQYTPYMHKSETTTVKTTNAAGGNSDIWPESVGFTSAGQPCVIISTENVKSNAHTIETTLVEVSEAYGATRTEELIQDFGDYVETTRWIICDGLDQIVDGAYTTVVTDIVVIVERNIYLTVGGATIWSDSKHGSFNITKNSNLRHEYYLNHLYTKEPTPLTTIRQGERIDDIETSSTPAMHIALNNIASDFVDGYAATYHHAAINETPTTRTKTNMHDHGTETIRYRLTGVVEREDYTDGPVVTDVIDEAGDIPDVITPSISVIDTTTGVVVSEQSFSWTNSGVSGYRSYFDGTAAWCPKNDSLLAISRRPAQPYVGQMYILDAGWASVSMDLLEPVIVYGVGSSTMFDFTKLSPFA